MQLISFIDKSVVRSIYIEMTNSDFPGVYVYDALSVLRETKYILFRQSSRGIVWNCQIVGKDGKMKVNAFSNYLYKILKSMVKEGSLKTISEEDDPTLFLKV